MNVAFANSAFESARAIMAQPAEVEDLGGLLAVLNQAAADPACLRSNPHVVRLTDDVAVVRHGRVRALIMVDPTVADRVIVAKVYLAGDDENPKAGAGTANAADLAHAH